MCVRGIINNEYVEQDRSLWLRCYSQINELSTLVFRMPYTAANRGVNHRATTQQVYKWERMVKSPAAKRNHINYNAIYFDPHAWAD